MKSRLIWLIGETLKPAIGMAINFNTGPPSSSSCPLLLHSARSFPPGWSLPSAKIILLDAHFQHSLSALHSRADPNLTPQGWLHSPLPSCSLWNLLLGLPLNPPLLLLRMRWPGPSKATLLLGHLLSSPRQQHPRCPTPASPPPLCWSFLYSILRQENKWRPVWATERKQKN